MINPKLKTHPVLKGVTDIWGPTDVYGVRKLPADAKVIVHGQVLAGMKPSDKPVEGRKNEPMMPLVWTRAFKTETGKTSRVLATTMGASTDLQSAGLRRLLVNGCYWGLGLEAKIPADCDVSYVGAYKPTRFGFGSFVKGIKPSDHALE